MLGIGDIVMPGLLLCFVLRYDNYKKQASGEVPGPGNAPGRMQRVSYFHCTLVGYFVGKRGIGVRMNVEDQEVYCVNLMEAIVLIVWVLFEKWSFSGINQGLIFKKKKKKMFHWCLTLWMSSGLLTATVASRIHRAAQPALLYLVPFTLLPLLTMAYLKVRWWDIISLYM